MCTGSFRKLYTQQAVSSRWDVQNLTGRTKEHAAVQLVMSTWLKKKGDEKNV
jgi:hypothetical protein